MRKILILLLTAVAALSARAYDFIYEGIIYTVIDEEARTVETKSGNKYGDEIGNYDVYGDITIPETVYDNRKTQYTVVRIGNYAFTYLRSIQIPNSVTSIGDFAFARCTSLTGIGIPNSVTSIGDHAFAYCSSLTGIEIPKSVKAIGNSAFQMCPLTSITVDKDNPSYTAIDNVLYSKDMSTLLKSATNKTEKFVIPNSVTNISNCAFYNCESLTDIEIPNSVTSIGNSAFYNCSSLTDIKIPNSVNSIGDYAFAYCKSLTDIEIPNSVTSIESYAFLGCESLTAIKIPNSVTSIGDYAFYNCTSLSAIEIPNSVTSIGNSAFYNCTGLKEVIIENGKEALTMGYNFPRSGLFKDSPLEKLHLGRNLSYTYSPFENISSLTSITIGETVTVIGNNAFKDCSNLTAIEIPNSVTSIESYAFSNCSSLTTLQIPNSVTSISDYAFSSCSSLTAIEIPNTITSIGDGAFSGCSSLTAIKIPNSVTSISDYAFNKCTKLKELIIEDGTEILTIGYNPDSKSGLFKDSPLEKLHLGRNLSCSYSPFANTNMTWSPPLAITIGETVTEIGDNAFYGCSKLTAIEIPNSITSIGSSAFYGCSKLTAIEIPNSVTSIGFSAFYGCSKLTAIEIPNSVTSIGASAFSCCSSLTSLSIGKAVTKIDIMAFYDCTGIREINVLNPTPPTLGHLAFPNNIYDSATLSIPEGTILDYLTANYWKNFISMKVGENEISYINDDVFKYLLIHEDNDKPTAILISGDYSSFSRASLPERVTDLSNPEQPRRYYLRAIGPSAFKDCKNLTEVTINSRASLETICASAFEGCDALKSFGIPATLKEIGSRAFYGCSNLNSITMPDGVKEIQTSCFYGCKNLSDFTIGSNVRLIGDYALYNTGIKSISIPASTDSIGRMAFANCPALEEFNLEESTQPICLGNYLHYESPVKSMYVGRTINGNRGFAWCKSLQSLTVGNLVTSLPDSTFYYCESLETLKFGSGLETIGSNAFSSTANKGRLTGVVIPSSVKSIGASAFAGHSITEVNIGCGVESIGEKAFDGSNVQTVAITAQQPPTAPNNAFSDYSGKLYLQGGQDVLDAYYDAYTCWDRFASYSMVEARRIEGDAVTSITGEPGDKIQLSATVYPSDATQPYIFWKSTNPSIATVDTNGLVTIMQPTDEDMASAGGCKIIASTLYANGPVLEYSVNGSESGIDDCVSDQEFSGETEVYTINGIRLGNSTEGLAPGIYIVRKGSKVSKIMIR